MKTPSPTVYGILKRASKDAQFAEDFLSDPEILLREYELTDEEKDYLKPFTTRQEIQQEYERIHRKRAAKRLLVGVVAFLFLILFATYYESSLYWPEVVRDFGILPWRETTETFRRVMFSLSLIAFFALLGVMVDQFVQQGPTKQVVILTILVILIICVGFVVISGMSLTARIALIQVLLVLLFTILPASLYSLFITTRGKTLWEEFDKNIARLEPVDYENLIEMYHKKFEALYGSVDKSGFGSALLQGEASFPVLFATFAVGLGWIIFFAVGEKATLELIMDGSINTGQVSTALASIKFAEPFLGGFVSTFTFGFLGAYLYSLGMLFRRYAQSDLKSVAYTHISQRILLTWVWAFILNVLPWEKLGVDPNYRTAFVSIFAFVVGVFPDVGWQVINEFLRAGLSLPLPSFREEYPLNKIDGMTIWVESRLMEEDIENVENLVTAGIMDLMLRTNLKPERIIHWIDQGILCLHLGRDDKENPNWLKQNLRKHGVRTATNLIDAYNNAKAQGRVFLSVEEDLLVSDLKAVIDNDPNMYHVRAWHMADAVRMERLQQAVVVSTRSAPA